MLPGPAAGCDSRFTLCCSVLEPLTTTSGIHTIAYQFKTVDVKGEEKSVFKAIYGHVYADGYVVDKLAGTYRPRRPILQVAVKMLQKVRTCTQLNVRHSKPQS